MEKNEYGTGINTSTGHSFSYMSAWSGDPDHMCDNCGDIYNLRTVYQDNIACGLGCATCWDDLDSGLIKCVVEKHIADLENSLVTTKARIEMFNKIVDTLPDKPEKEKDSNGCVVV